MGQINKIGHASRQRNRAKKRTRTDVYAQLLAMAQQLAAKGSMWPSNRSHLAQAGVIRYPLLNCLMEEGIPDEGLPPIVKALTMPVQLRLKEGDKPADILMTRFTQAFFAPDTDVAAVIIAAAMDNGHPNQAVAWKLMCSYGFGLPQKNLDDSSVKRLATEMMEQALEAAKKRKAEAALDAEVLPADPAATE